MTAPEAGWEHFEVEADVGVRGWGATLAEAFAQTALGVLALIVRPEEVQARETREVRAQADGAGPLLVEWVNECLYVHEIEGFVVRTIDVSVCDGGRVHAFLRGEPLDLARHRPGIQVKAATRHGVEVRQAGGRHETRLMVDV
ncbi:MAG TPA: archease [Methylomirabilota bacterium]|nr:archease [Methylomirabilota bacterium]